jgi:hypothetical protein
MRQHNIQNIVQVLLTFAMFSGITALAFTDITTVQKSSLGITTIIFLFFCIVDRITKLFIYIVKRLERHQTFVFCKALSLICQSCMALCSFYLISMTITVNTCSKKTEPIYDTPLCSYAKTISCLYVFSISILGLWLSLCVTISLVFKRDIINRNNTVFIVPTPSQLEQCAVTSDIICSICLTDKIGSSWTTTKCNHVFHTICINDVISHGHTNCPLCRDNL